MSNVRIPWHYRWGFSNWLMAKPWTWSYRMIYRQYRKGVDYTFKNGRHYYVAPKGRLKSAWAAVRFPHVHHPDEE